MKLSPNFGLESDSSRSSRSRTVNCDEKSVKRATSSATITHALTRTISQQWPPRLPSSVELCYTVHTHPCQSTTNNPKLTIQSHSPQRPAENVRENPQPDRRLRSLRSRGLCLFKQESRSAPESKVVPCTVENCWREGNGSAYQRCGQWFGEKMILQRW